MRRSAAVGEKKAVRQEPRSTAKYSQRRDAQGDSEAQRSRCKRNADNHDPKHDSGGEPEVDGPQGATCRLHVRQSQLGLGQLRDLGRTTVRAAEDVVLDI